MITPSRIFGKSLCRMALALGLSLALFAVFGAGALLPVQSWSQELPIGKPGEFRQPLPTQTLEWLAQTLPNCRSLGCRSIIVKKPCSSAPEGEPPQMCEEVQIECDYVCTWPNGTPMGVMITWKEP